MRDIVKTAAVLQPAPAVRRLEPAMCIAIPHRLAAAINRALMAASHPKDQQEFADIIREQVPLAATHVLFSRPAEPGVNWRAIGGTTLD